MGQHRAAANEGPPPDEPDHRGVLTGQMVRVVRVVNTIGRLAIQIKGWPSVVAPLLSASRTLVGDPAHREPQPRDAS